MTLRYSDMNQHDALYKTARAYPGGIEALAGRMGISEKVLYNKLRPAIHTHYASFEEVSEIVELCHGAGVKNAFLPLHALNWRHGHVSFAMPENSGLPDDQLALAVCRVMKEVGDIAAALEDALKNGKIDAHEMDRLEREFQEGFAAMGEFRARIRQRFGWMADGSDA